MTPITRRTALAALGAAITAPAHAHSVQELKDEFYAKEEYFEAFDKPVPDFTLSDAAGALVHPADFLGQVVVLHFIYSSCPDVCPLHAEKLAEVQREVIQTPMKDRVRFVSITTDPTKDTAAVLTAYGPQHGLDPLNWQFLTIAPGAPEDTTRTLAKAFGHSFTVESDGTQTHGVVTHIIGKFGRWQGNFHGLEFQTLNMVMFINALTNDYDKPELGFWDRLWGWL